MKNYNYLVSLLHIVDCDLQSTINRLETASVLCSLCPMSLTEAEIAGVITCIVACIDNDDDGEDFPVVANQMAIEQQVQNILACRRTVPKVANFVEVTVPRFTNCDFRNNFRLSRATSEHVLQMIAPHLAAQGARRPTVPIEKQFLMSLWLLGNLETYRLHLCCSFNILFPLSDKIFCCNSYFIL